MNMKWPEKQEARVPNETLIISRTDEGFRVYSPANPLNSYIVSGSPEVPSCTCPDFEHHAGSLNWHCKHIKAVLEQFSGSNGQKKQSGSYDKEERLAIQNENQPPKNEDPAPSKGAPQMLLKRSVSPDGRIDSLSIEFACSVEQMPEGEIKSRAFNILKIQSEIIKSFLNGSQNSSKPETHTGASNGSMPAKMLSISGMNTKWGRRLFINVEAGGNTLKLFGNQKQLADAIAAAGFSSLVDHIDERVELNIPCRITTKPSEDGKYLNVDRVSPLNGHQSHGKERA
jgi:hypothetical protein